MIHLVMSAVRIGGVAYVGMCLLLFLRQSKYVYYPTRKIDLTPAQLGMAFQSVTLQTEDGEKLGAWYVPAETNNVAPSANGPLTLLFCHGNAGNIGDRVGSLRVFHDLGFHVLVFDYRGYGESSGKPSEKGTYKDVAAAWNYLTKDRSVPDDQIVLFGRSLGGAPAAWLAEHKKPRALILESIFTSASDMAKRMFRYLPVSWLIRYKYNTLARMPNIHCPVFVAHSRDDDLIPFKMGRRIYAAANDPKQFEEMTGGHNAGGLDIHPEYQKRLKAFCCTGEWRGV